MRRVRTSDGRPHRSTVAPLPPGDALGHRGRAAIGCGFTAAGRPDVLTPPLGQEIGVVVAGEELDRWIDPCEGHPDRPADDLVGTVDFRDTGHHVITHVDTLQPRRDQWPHHVSGGGRAERDGTFVVAVIRDPEPARLADGRFEQTALGRG